jgi:hypothetical protein
MQQGSRTTLPGVDAKPTSTPDFIGDKRGATSAIAASRKSP